MGPACFLPSKWGKTAALENGVALDASDYSSAILELITRMPLRLSTSKIGQTRERIRGSCVKVPRQLGKGNAVMLIDESDFQLTANVGRPEKNESGRIEFSEFHWDINDAAAIIPPGCI
ncbi:MAG: hypothetical protein LBQ12_02760 [Deltaproteobacteria bacterium]|nr:hypothetical protein [Deltaproteobacteria bacterium]